MVELKVYLSEGVNEKFRRTAMNVYGYGRGSLSRAAEEAFVEWCTKHDGQSTSPSMDTLRDKSKKPAEETASKIDPDERQGNTLQPASIAQDSSSDPVESGH